jgi:NAD(P)-dependent dehydrogenase (short-subunit alcohol dehydrogenase family)
MLSGLKRLGRNGFRATRAARTPQEDIMTIAGKTVLVAGAGRGIGQALVAEALARGAGRVYAGTRQPLAHPDGRVTPLTLDITSPAQIQAAADQVESLDILINNAGLGLPDDLTDRAALGPAPGRQPVRHLRRHPGLPAAAD